MRPRTVLFLALMLSVPLPAFARPKMIPIASSFIGAAASSSPSSFVRVGGKVFFTANDGVHGVEPWVTDGTSGGATMLPSSGATQSFIGTLGSAAIFWTYDESRSMWRTDGTAAGHSS